MVVVDMEGVASGASRCAGGFLARNWGSGEPRGKLARRSFDLHRALPRMLYGGASAAAEIWTPSMRDAEADLAVGYRTVDAVALRLRAGDGVPKNESHDDSSASGLQCPTWVDSSSVRAVHVLARACDRVTAQVSPKLLAQALIAAYEPPGGGGVKSNGGRVQVVRGRVDGVLQAEGAACGLLQGLRIDGADSAASSVVFCMGAWSSSVAEWVVRHRSSAT